MTSKLIFRNSKTLQWKNEKKLFDKKFPSYLTQFFYFLYFKISELCNSEVLFSLNTSPKPCRPFFWTKLEQQHPSFKRFQGCFPSNLDFSLAYFTYFNFVHFEIEESFRLIWVKLQNGQFHLQIFLSGI